jgi:histone H3/H4
MSDDTEQFRVCSSCRQIIHFGARYYTCSVSTCNRVKMTLTFCSVPCFEAHVPMLRHREAWAEERRAPTFEQRQAEIRLREEQEQSQQQAAAKDPRATQAARDRQQPEQGTDTGRLARVAANGDAGASARVPSVERQAATATGWKPAASKELSMSNEEIPKEVLVVISKVKAYIRAKSSMNTSDAVTEALSELVRTTCDQAVERAKSEGRKTVMARDITGGSTPE